MDLEPERIAEDDGWSCSTRIVPREDGEAIGSQDSTGWAGVARPTSRPWPRLHLPDASDQLEELEAKLVGLHGVAEQPLRRMLAT